MAALTRAEVMNARDPTVDSGNAAIDVPRGTHARGTCARVVPMKPTGFTPTDPQDHPQSDPQDGLPEGRDPVDGDADVLAAQLMSLWAELDRQGAVVNRIPLDAHPDILRARIEHEARRIRALRERP